MYGSVTQKLLYFQQSGIEHIQGAGRGAFVFTVGSTIFGNYGFPGYFYNVQFDYKSDIIKNYNDAFIFVKKSIAFKLPPQMNPNTNYVQLVGDQELVSKDTDTYQESNSKYFKRIFKYYGAEEYSVQGWFKAVGNIKSNEKILLFRVAGNQPGEINADKNEGDMNLGCYLFNNEFNFAYFKSFVGKAAEGMQVYTIPYSNTEITAYFWLYMGYSSLSKRLVYYIRTWKSEYQGAIE